MNCPICLKTLPTLRTLRTHLTRLHTTISETEKVSILLRFTGTTLEELFCMYHQGVSIHTLSRQVGINLTGMIHEMGIDRTHSQTKQMAHYKEKYAATVRQRYGVESVSQIPAIKTKKRNTCLERYGVVHNWQMTEVREKATQNTNQENAVQQRRQGVIEKYGVDNVSQVPSIKAKQVATHKQTLAAMTLEQRQIMTQAARKKSATAWISKPHLRVCQVFDSFGVSYTKNCPMFGFNYDLVFKHERVVIEVNGTYWHGDPRKYKATDLIYGKEAKKIWEKDARKLEVARNAGYKTLVIWEADLPGLSNNQIYSMWENV